MLIAGFVIAAILSVMLLTKTAELRYQRDVNRMVYNDNLGVLSEVKAKLGMTGDSLNTLLSSTCIFELGSMFSKISRPRSSNSWAS